MKGIVMVMVVGVVVVEVVVVEERGEIFIRIVVE